MFVENFSIFSIKKAGFVLFLPLFVAVVRGLWRCVPQHSLLMGLRVLFAVAFAPQVVPYFKVGAPKGFQGVLCRESGDALHTVDEVAQFVVG